MTITIRLLHTDDEFEAIYPFIEKLNDGMSQQEFRFILEEMRKRDYYCAGAFTEDGSCVGICGYWIEYKFWCRKAICLDHLIVNEETNFMARTKIILRGGLNPVLQPINMTEHLERFGNTPVTTLLKTFSDLRQQNIKTLHALTVTNEDLSKTALHPKVGIVQLKHVLATWVAHDLVHIGQITRVMAKQCKQEVGPFIEFLPRIR